MTVNPVDILKSWHLIEFFQPYQIKERKFQAKVTNEKVTSQSNRLLPWLESSTKRQLNIDQVGRYTLYLGVFDLNVAQKICDSLDSSDARAEENAERLNLDGLSCVAKLSLDEYGVPDLDSFSVSSFWWALGCLQGDRLNELSSDQFQSKYDDIKETLTQLSRHLYPLSNDESKLVVHVDWITQLIAELEHWADFVIDRKYSFVLEWTEKYKKKSARKPEKMEYIKKDQGEKSTRNIVEFIDQEGAVLSFPNDGNIQKDLDAEVDDDESLNALKPEMPIFNSFYFDDIEASIASFNKGHAGLALKQYLSIEHKKTVDLYTPEGLKAIQKRVSVVNTPQGRWPSDPDHNMALMQQYAINTALDELKDGGLLSVNGPPGTGKTTLLRDLIAHNIVERASVLCTFNNVSESLTKDGFPVASLAGFEMLVASSNNKAVENISRELPQIKSIADCFADLSYLKPIANQLNAKKVKDKYLPMAEEELCWGAISVVLGKKGNRQDVKQRFFFDAVFPKDSSDESQRDPNKDFLNFWRWKALVTSKKEPVVCFSSAKKAFLSAKQKLDIVFEELATLERLYNGLSSGELLKKINKHESELIKLEEVILDFSRKKDEFKSAALMAKNVYDISVNDYEKHHQEKPNWFIRLFFRRRYKRYLQKQCQLNDQKLLNQKRYLDSQADFKTVSYSLSEKNKTLVSNTAELKKIKNLFFLHKQSYQALLDRFDGIVIPQPSEKINNPEVQRNAYWQSPEVNQLRSELFVCAMKLHEAWLHEASSGGGAFHTNICRLPHLMEQPHKEADPESLWRLFFMIFPVASSTFASISRMLKGVSEEALGWLMIDEAGQAIPQAAVGAIMRSKRVLVVGDPLQVEPVFTTPPVLVKLLGETILGDQAEDWSPNSISVQQVADRANRFGSYIATEDKKIWIGIPLWVHRRCIEPMFSVANKIAYNDRMIHGRDDDAIKPKSAHGVDNSWIESVGVCSDKQYKRELGEDTLALLKELLEAGNELNSIFVISPFKAVKEALLSNLSECAEEVLSFSTKAISKGDFSSWLEDSIGTVHAFQGRENDIVIMVLGCDPHNTGGATWASSTPNILNVAITRAKKNLFVIGDSNVWCGLKYFSAVYDSLPLSTSKKGEEIA